MNKSILGMILIAVLAVAGSIAGSIWAIHTYSFRMATIDMDRVFKQSKLGQKINAEILSKRNELAAKFSAAKTNQEKAALQFENDKYSADKQKEFLGKAKSTVAKVCRQKGFKAVTNVSPQFYSEVDLTDSVIQEMK